ncbi:DegT/DnrJ/EryC1/StrS family aminotransferase [Burkholderia territorii]|uniref:DegT/DnrJ/EryC1/StrS family aminotransferase n=1 Tax=Burkholderia territorii TaxID=1503055 RepID=UPI000B04E6B9|nr:aminotransferase class I/II-fold pyridoxal phosphate-dependent enzyme [Burkholderia territorii]
MNANLKASLAINGGMPVRSRELQWPTYEKGDTFLNQDDENAAREAIEGRRYYRYDNRPYEETYNGKLERKICEMLGSQYALACTSGTTAIALALMALELPPGSLIGCSAFTFAATPSAILLAGHRPYLIGCDENLNLCLDSLKKAVKHGIRAMVVVHMRGFASDMVEICDIAKQGGIPVIEDAVPVLGVKQSGRYLGTFGKIGAFSTQADKPINTGEGGFLVTNDERLYAVAVVLCGAYENRVRRHFAGRMPGVNPQKYPVFAFRMDEIRAALALSIFKRLPQRLEAHRANYDNIVRMIRENKALTLRQPVDAGAYLGQFLNFRLAGRTAETCIEFAKALCAEGIEAKCLADTDVPNSRAFWNWSFLPIETISDESLVRAKNYLSETIDIPISANLRRRDLFDVAAAIDKVSNALL